MLIVRVLTAAVKPALVSGAIASAAAGGWFAIDRLGGEDLTAFQQVQAAGQRLVISEFGETEDAIVAVDPADPSVRHTIATVQHAPGWGIFATLAPDGSALAYTALPPDTAKPAPDAPAQAAIVDADGDVTLLASDIDLLIAPVWSPDSASIVVRRNTPAADSAGTFELLLLGRDGARTTLTQWQSAAVFPVAFAPDGSKLYFTTLRASGVDLYSIAPDGSAETLVAHLSDDISRGWTLSPDGTTLAYSVAETGAQPRTVTVTLDLATGVTSDAVSGNLGDEFAPAWRGDGDLTIAAVKPQGGGDAVVVGASGGATPVTRNDESIDLPLGWSPDGATLAVRAVDGASAFEAGESHVEVVDAAGGRVRVSDSADALIVGWME